MTMFAQAPVAPSAAGTAYQLTTRPETQFAHDLLRLGQVDLIRAEREEAKGTPAENLWKAQYCVAAWDSLTRTKADRATAEREYLGAVTRYLTSQTAGIDGVWALDHAEFIFARLSEPIINRMEYWSSSAKDRAELGPMADLADVLLRQAALSLKAGLHQAETSGAGGSFDEAGYTRNFRAIAEVEYYSAWSKYFQAMAKEPTDPVRKALLLSAAEALGKWADDPQDNGVNNQSRLLRGKALSEAGDEDKAVVDLTRASEDPNAPAWVRYQARYQLVIARMRAGTFGAANAELDAFKKSIPSGNADAQISTDMLAFRVAWAEAQSKQGDERKEAQTAALQILSNIIQRDPRYRDLVYQQLAAQIPEDATLADLMPLQQLAVAYIHSQGQKGDTPASRDELKRAADAAAAVHDNPAASPGDRIEATFIAGVTNALLNNVMEAAKYNVEFVQLAPTDSRAKAILDLALQQIGELRKGSGKQESPELMQLQERALTLATSAFHDSRWQFAQARTLEDNGKLAEAAKMFSALPDSDPNYLDARFQLVSIATTRFNQLPATAGQADVRAAATDLFNACTQFVAILDHPPATANQEAVARAKAYRADIWLIETSTALHPAVKQMDVAIDRLGKLEAMKDQLSPAQQAAVLRYRVQVYQLTGQADKAFETVQEYAKTQGKDANGIIHQMALSMVQEVEQAEKSDPSRAKQLAQYVVKLLDPLIEAALHDEKLKANAYGYQQLQADMMIRAGQYQQAQDLAGQLIGENGQDLLNNMIEARAIFARARDTGDKKAYGEAEDYFGRILPKVINGSDSYWECWLRILESKEALAGADASETIRKRLNDLRAAFGPTLGGDAFKEEFARFAGKYEPAATTP
ncbi:MAG TPA: hypothetical protein VM008_03890 [Phycisphaerae bacterium]|nr:hypothetical protein [Phycisphaerae bacterium]